MKVDHFFRLDKDVDQLLRDNESASHTLTRLVEDAVRKVYGKIHKIEKIPVQEVIDLYNETLGSHGLPKCMKKTTKRAGHIKARWKDELGSLDQWKNYFKYVYTSDFLMGRVKSDRPFRADLDWLINENNFAKILEKKYENESKEKRA